MKIKKVFGAFAVLLALTVVACNAPAGDKSGSSKKPSGTSQTSQTPKINVTAEGGKTSIEINATLQFTADPADVTWSSSDTAVATIDSTGKVTGLKPGSTTIKAVKEGYKDGTFSLKVAKPAAPHPAEPTWPAECPALIDTTDWTPGTAAKNLYGKDYTPLTAADGSVGVKMALTDFDPTSVGSFDSSGKIDPTNEATAYIDFSLRAPKAGVYQMILKASCSTSGDDYKFAGESSRGFDIKVNGFEDQDNVYGDRLYTDANLDHNEKRFFIFGLVQLNGPDYEDTISFRNPYYRMKFDTSAGIIFAENK